MLIINNLSVSLEQKDILRNISLHIESGEFVSIIGPNGAGKSTFLKAVSGLIDIRQGDITLKNKKINQYSKKELAKIITLIPQETVLQFDLSVEEMVLMGRFPYLDYWGNYTLEDRQLTGVILEKLHIHHLSSRSFNSLSGGEKQKVLIARALAQDSSIIMLDETLSFLDMNHQIETMELLSKIHLEDRKTIILISHNLNLSNEYSDRIVIFKNGQLMADGTPRELINKEMLSAAFGAEIDMLQNPKSGNPVIYYTRAIEGK